CACSPLSASQPALSVSFLSFPCSVTASGMHTAHSPIERPPGGDVDRAGAELLLASNATAAGERQVELVVPEIHCAGCIARIERALAQLPHVTDARVNLTTKRVRVRWRASSPPPIIE